MKCSTCGKCKECGSGVVWTGLSPAGNANATAMNYVYHIIGDMNTPQIPSVWINAAPAAAAGSVVTLTVPSSPCADCDK